MLTTEEIEVLLRIIGETAIKGNAARTIVALQDKLERLKLESTPLEKPTN